ncbi:MAG: LptA/OstA family protein [Sphingomonadales bacterium]
MKWITKAGGKMQANIRARTGGAVTMVVVGALAGAVMAVLTGVTTVVLAQSDVSALGGHDFRRAIDISADRLEVRTEDNRAIFEGSVEAVQEDLRLKADRVVVHYQTTRALGSSGSAPTIARIDVAGRVNLVSPSETVNSEWGVYDLDERLITLGGGVILERGDVKVEGDRLVVNLDTGVTTLETADTGAEDADGQGRVRGRFVPPERTNGREQ